MRNVKQQQKKRLRFLAISFSTFTKNGSCTFPQGFTFAASSPVAHDRLSGESRLLGLGKANGGGSYICITHVNQGKSKGGVEVGGLLH